MALGDVAEIFDGPHATPPKTVAGPIFLGISNLARGRLDLSSVEHVSEENYRSWTHRVTPREGDVVFSYETRIGEAAIIPAGLRCCLGRRMGLIRVRQGIDPRFLLYAYLSPGFQGVLRAHTVHGTTVDRISLNEMPQFPIDVPEDPDEQRAIADILFALDEKIALNAGTNETLDALATALFSRVLDEARHDGAPGAHLADHIEAARGLSYTGAGLGSGLPLHNLNSIREGGGYKRDGIKFYAGEYKERHLVLPGEIVVANTEQAHTNTLIGYPAIVPARFGEVGLFSQDLYRVRVRDGSPLTASSLYLLLRSEPLRSIVAGYRNGTTVSHLPAEALARPTFPLLSADRIRALDAQVTPLLAKIEANEDENETLAALRDALLPRLVSGELRVRPSEAVVAATT